MDIITAAIGAVAGAGCLAALALVTHRIKHRTPAQADPQPQGQVQPPPADLRTPSRWRALPGNVLELADTGFYIRMDLRPHMPLYALHMPEHYVLATHCSLAPLKALGEVAAAERAEFKPPAPLPASFWRAEGR